jgi:hypothetical protein
MSEKKNCFKVFCEQFAKSIKVWVREGAEPPEATAFLLDASAKGVGWLQ